MPHVNDELHHSGWNACSSCYTDASKSRSRLILPCLESSRVYVIDTATDPRKPRIDKVGRLPFAISLIAHSLVTLVGS